MEQPQSKESLELQQQLAAQTYSHVHVGTAGVLKTHQLLLERALLLIGQIQLSGDLVQRDQAQNIVSQLQHSLNLDYLASCQLFEMLGMVWDALERNEPEYIHRAADLLSQLRELVVEVQKM